MIYHAYNGNMCIFTCQICQPKLVDFYHGNLYDALVSVILIKQNMDFINQLFSVIESRKREKNKDSYTSELFLSGINRISQKVGEEAVESVVASVAGDKKELIYEMSDLWYHCLVMLSAHDLTPEDLITELKRRHEKK